MKLVHSPSLSHTRAYLPNACIVQCKKESLSLYGSQIQLTIQQTQQTYMLAYNQTKVISLTESVCHHFQITGVQWQRVSTNTEPSQTRFTSLLSCSSRFSSAACFLPLTKELIKVISLKVTVLQHQLQFRKVRQMEDSIQEWTCSHLD